MEERLQKILSQWGLASRRQAEQMILDGRVMLNGTIAILGQKADPERDTIEVDRQLVQAAERPQQVYLLLHKPAGVVSSCHDPWQRPTVLHLLPPDLRYLYPVGRLDVDSTGALLLTNDGQLTFCLTHPRHQVDKTYHVWLQGHPSESVLQIWRDGVDLAGRPTLPAQIRVLERRLGPHPQTKLEIILREGRNRQIRRVAEQLGYPVLQLHRIAIGPVQLQPDHEPELPSGDHRPLKHTELEFLRTLIGIVLGSSGYLARGKKCQL